MSLKELTADKHRAAETTQFMKAVFAKTLPRDHWVDFTYQKTLFYSTIETAATQQGLMSDLEPMRRSALLAQDYEKMDGSAREFKPAVLEYHNYIQTLTDPTRIMAHLYTWHMGDLFGGQMIKKLVDGPHSSLDFLDPPVLIAAMRSKLSDDMAEEANIAFDWAIQILNEYDH
jgi:heme oxygenase